MKKSNFPVKFSLLLFFFIISVIELEAISLDITIKSCQPPSLSVILINVDKEKIIKTIDANYRSQIIIQYRLFNKEKIPLLGDKLIYSTETVKTADIDIFSAYYRITSDEDVQYFFQKDDFLISLLSHDIVFPSYIKNYEYLPDCYVKIKAIVINKVLNKPFNILYLIYLQNSESTGWTTKEIIQENNDY
ncbi:MAG: hypothetical protein GY756_03995 [bacterium]|nr:hypothetical protein [bacterium]